MSDNTKRLTIYGLFWNAIERFGNQFIVLLTTVVTAKIMPVKDFAVLPAILIYSVVATAIVDSGLATSLVRSKNVEERDYSSMFVFNIILSISIYLILFFCAPLIEKYSGNDGSRIDGLATYARVLFIQLIVHSLGIVQYVKLLKAHQFKITARINLLSVILSGTIVIVMTFLGYGLWGLILQQLLYSTFRTLFLWSWGDWKPSLLFDFNSIRAHLKFSISFMVSNVLGKIITPLYAKLVQGRFTGLETGFYDRANKLGETPNMLISSIVQGTTLSTLSGIQDDVPRYLNACRKSMQSMAFALFPVCLLAIIVVEPTFHFLWHKKWDASIILFQWLCFTGLFISLTDLNVNFLNIKGRSKITLYLEILKSVLAIVFFFLTYKEGLLMVVYGQLAVRIICFLVVTFFSAKVYGYNFSKQFSDIISTFILSVIAGVLAYLPLHFQVVSIDLFLVIIQSIIFAVVYLFLCHITKNQIWIEVLTLIRSKIAKKA